MSVAEPGKTYYHINNIRVYSPHARLRAGDEVDVGGVSNPYFHWFETQRIAVTVPYDDGTVREVPGKQFLQGVSNGTIQADVATTARIGADLANHMVKYVRELIWEDIRRHEFPHLPSRQRCVWLIPTMEGVKYWSTRAVSPEGFQVLKVEVQGRMHTASESYLLSDSEPMEETIKKARQYWLGVVENTDTKEILFEGRMRVVEVVDPSRYSV